MAIRANIDLGVQAVNASDTQLVTIPVGIDRRAVTRFVLFNTAATNVTVSVYQSPDATSANGDQIAEYTLPADTSVEVVEAVGGLSENIVAIADAVGVNAKITVINYDDGS